MQSAQAREGTVWRYDNKLQKSRKHEPLGGEAKIHEKYRKIKTIGREGKLKW